MKNQFQLEDWLKDKSQKVVTRCGFPVKIVCTDVKRKDYPILALVERDDQEEYQSFTKDGRFSLYNPLHDNFDLFIETADEVCEDEKVRKALLEMVHDTTGDELLVDYNVHKEEALAWLERQGENPTTLPKWKYKKDNTPLLRDSIILNKYGCVAKSPSGAIVSDVWIIDYDELAKLPKEERKLEKIEQKSDFYCKEHCKGFQETGKCFADGECKAKREAEQKPASEEDEPQKELAKSYLAKFDEKFPILPTLKGKQLADYKNFLNKCQQIFGLRYWDIRPIQAKLFEKLSLLWAAWGAEHLQGLGQTDGDMDNEISMWSEEDEKMLDSICVSINEESVAEALRSRGDSYSIEDLTAICSKQINWLQSLQDRVLSQPKQEWSDDDKRKIDRIYSILRQAADTHAFSTSCRLIGDKECMELQDWLKSLRPQNRWKPNDEQIAQLQIVIDTYGNEGICDPILTELLFQLKKLKEGKV